MNIKNKIIALLLATVMLVSAMPISALAAQDDSDALAYGRADSSHVVTVSPSELLSLLLGETLSAAERDYLDRYCDRILEYYDRIPAGGVKQISIDDRLTVTAEVFSYTAENGETVSWIPQEVVYRGRARVAMTENDDGKYEAEIEDVSVDTDEATGNRIGIVYACALSIPATVVNELASFAYDDAVAARDFLTTAEYTAQYAAARRAYEAYLRDMDAYADAYARYEQYLSERGEYLTEKEKYEEYLTKKAAYDQQQVAYDQYTRDLAAYEAAKAEYDRVYRENSAAYEAYVAYLSNLNRIRASTYAMESLFTRPTSNKTGTLYNALQNAELVAMFEQHRDGLVSLGVSGDTLTHLRTTSDQLNAMLQAYAAAREQSEEAAFLYYKANYHEISRLFNYLYDNMREVVKGSIFNYICSAIELQYKDDKEMATYKKWRIKNVLAHIYLICQTLDDTDTGDGTFQFYADNGAKQTYYFSDLLDQNLILTDNNCACPDAISWMPAVEPVTLPEPPTKPTPVSRPVPPTAVSEPTAPEVVEPPTVPPHVEEPREATDEERAQHAFADRAADIVSALKAGTLQDRGDTTEPKTLSRTVTLTCPISFGNGRIVTFYAANGEILSAEELAEGDRIVVPKAPATYEDVQYCYTFVDFATDPDADPENLPALPDTMQGEDLAFYAIYRKELRKYKVTFDADNGTTPIEMILAYGTEPTPPQNPEKSATAETVYTFAGWSPTVSAVKGEITYTAQWQESERLYDVTWNTPSGEVVRRERYDETPTAPTVPTVYYEGCVRYDFEGFSPSPQAVTGDVTYTAQYRRTVLAEGDNEELTLEPSLGEYTLTGTGARAAVGSLFDVAKSEKKRVKLSFPTHFVSLDADAVKSLERAGVAYTAALRDTAGGVGVGFYSADGSPVRVSDGTMHLLLVYEPKAGATLCTLAQDAAGNRFVTPCTQEDDFLAVAATAHRTYRVAYQFPLTVKGSGGTVFANAEQYFEGDKPNLVTYPAPQRVLSEITLTNDLTGEVSTLSSLADFTMPAYPATLTVSFVPRTYCVTFISRGTVVSEAQYELGAEVKIPQIETDFVENGYRYTFIGWSAPIDTVTADATYTAKFFAVPIEEVPENPTGDTWATGTVLWKVGLPAVLIVAVLATGVTFLVIWRRKKKKLK